MVCFVLTPRCFAYRHAATTFYQLQRGFRGRRQHVMRGSRNFCQFYLVLSLFHSLQRGSKGFIAERTIPILYQGSRGVHYFPGGGCPIFSRGGPNANFYRNPYTYLLFSRGCSDPLSPSGSHMGNVIITGQYLSHIIVRH